MEITLELTFTGKYELIYFSSLRVNIRDNITDTQIGHCSWQSMSTHTWFSCHYLTYVKMEAMVSVSSDFRI